MVAKERPTERRRADDVYLTELLAARNGAAATAFGRYALRAVALNGRQYARSLMTEVGLRSVESSVELAVPLEARFRTFRATVGRDPTETAAGPACVYFEVWGDDRRLFLSQALRSAVHLVKVAPGAGNKVRRTPQDVDVPVRGVQVLRLVTRYADDFVQQAAQVERGRGCVWGDPRLELDEAARRPVREEPLRDALRGPLLRLSATASLALATAPLPLKLAVAPLRLDGPVVQGPPEPMLRAVVSDLLSRARRGPDGLFVPVGRREAERFAASLPPRRPALSDTEEARLVTEAARRVSADVAVTGFYAPPAARQPGRLTLTLWEARGGTRLGNQAVTLPAP